MNDNNLFSEQELLIQAINGNQQALNQLIKYYYPFIKQEIRRKYNRIALQDVDDICQNTCYAIIENITKGKYEFRKIKFSAYVRTITHNKTFDFMRIKYSKDDIVYAKDTNIDGDTYYKENYNGAVSDDIDDMIIEMLEYFTYEIIEKMFNLLPDKQSITIKLRIFEGLKYEQIATLHSVPFNTVVARFRYGIKKLRKIIEDINLFGDDYFGIF